MRVTGGARLRRRAAPVERWNPSGELRGRRGVRRDARGEAARPRRTVRLSNWDSAATTPTEPLGLSRRRAARRTAGPSPPALAAAATTPHVDDARRRCWPRPRISPARRPKRLVVVAVARADVARAAARCAATPGSSRRLDVPAEVTWDAAVGGAKQPRRSRCSCTRRRMALRGSSWAAGARRRRGGRRRGGGAREGRATTSRSVATFARTTITRRRGPTRALANESASMRDDSWHTARRLVGTQTRSRGAIEDASATDGCRRQTRGRSPSGRKLPPTAPRCTTDAGDASSGRASPRAAPRRRAPSRVLEACRGGRPRARGADALVSGGAAPDTAPRHERRRAYDAARVEFRRARRGGGGGGDVDGGGRARLQDARAPRRRRSWGRHESGHGEPRMARRSTMARA